MAKVAITQIIDDLDGKILSESEARTIRFGINGAQYRIDLSKKNAKELHKLLDYYAQKGRKLSTKESKPAKKSKVDVLGPLQSSNIRHWASTNGYTVKDRGRIPLNVRAAYDAAH